MDDPKPCPWCGGTNIATSVSEMCCPIEYSAEAYCVDCGSVGPGGSGICATAEDAEDGAIESWNSNEYAGRARGDLAEKLAEACRLMVRGKWVSATQAAKRTLAEWDALNDGADIDVVTTDALKGE